jgi:hypothetical protein
MQMAMMKQVLELSGRQTMLLQGAQQPGGFNMSALQHAAGVSLPGVGSQARCAAESVHCSSAWLMSTAVW